MRGKFLVAVLALAGVVLLWAVIQLFEVRFSRGDVYPAYSSLRTDPLGTKAFYESLAGIEGLTVSRNETALERFAAPSSSTLFFAGTTGLYASELEIVKLEQFVRHGGRMIIAFYPQPKETNLVEKPSKKEKSTPTPTPTPNEEEPMVKFLSNRDIEKRWDLKFGAASALAKSTAKVADPAAVDPEISWHSALHFKDSAPDWRTIYTSHQLPVVIERSMGAGTIVMASDSYFLSNEALRRERRPAFLSWLVGPNRNIIFDETHLGINQTPGISTLIRRYHLGGLLAGLALIAALAVWKNSARLLPATETNVAGEEILTGKESFGGFVNLLRRNISPGEVLPTAIEQWAKHPQGNGGVTSGETSASSTAPKSSGPSPAQTQIDRARQIVATHPRDVVGAYQQIARALHQTKWNPHKPN